MAFEAKQGMRIKVITWNVAEKGPPKDFSRLLGFDSKLEPDVYAIGLQELNSSISTLASEAISNDVWTNTISGHLIPREYIRLKTIRMMGIHLAVYVKKKHLLYTTNIEVSFSRSGLGGMWGNKGAVSVRLDFYGVTICFVNCHFTAHQPNYFYRIQDYEDAIMTHTFRDPLCSNILDHDYVFWLGDLNFRIDNLSKSEIEAKVKERDYTSLQKTDQLTKAKEAELILLDFVEAPLTFPPTYKFDMGTDIYDTSKKQRKPAWCDRILYLVHEDAFEGFELSVQQLSYTCLMEYKNSDHKPVLADFLIQVLDFPPELPVMFEPISQWCCSRDASCTYTVSTELPVSSWDWIGLFKKNFTDAQDYVTYAWASTEGDTMKDGDCKLYSFKIDKSYLQEAVGEFYLAYYSYNKDCFVGYSDLFSISLTEESSDSSDDGLSRKKRK